MISSSTWYKDAIIYQLHVRAFRDSNVDGVGDFAGLVEKLDYIRDLGVTAIWLLPFYPSPLRDDGYDIADYVNIHSSYGNLRDFKHFLKEAHARDLRVITELVINHTSDQHEWFQRSRRAPRGSVWRNFYVWEDDPTKYREARIIFKDFETSNWEWDGVAGQYFWHRFYHHQPDLNFQNPEVQAAVLKVLDFWMDLGVDAFRLDAVPYLFEREGTTCENLPETHEFLKKLRRHVDQRYPDRMLLAEANQWPEDAAAYFGDGDECHMNFHFPLMPRLFMAVQREDRLPVIDILEQTPPIPENCQWALFLRNHDELTLEMVTDEERDYMYRAYAADPRARINLGIRRRLAPLLGNNRRKIELLNGLLFSLPGTPIVYYGDEIGMGDNIYLGDRDSVRTPMQWSPDRNAGFSQANPQRLYLPVVVDPEFHFSAINVEAQDNNPHSLLWWMRRMIALRKRFPVFGRGTLEFLYPDNSKVLVFLRRLDSSVILVVANLSRYAQYVEIDLSAFQGLVPVELLGQTRFPPIGELPYLLTLTPHSFYWFSLVPQVTEPVVISESMLPELRTRGTWDRVFTGRARGAFELALGEYVVRTQPRHRQRVLQAVKLEGSIPLTLPGHEEQYHLGILRITYDSGEPEIVVLALTLATGQKCERLMREHPERAIARVVMMATSEEGIIFDAVVDATLCLSWLEVMSKRLRLKGAHARLVAWSSRDLRKLREREDHQGTGMPSTWESAGVSPETLRILPGGAHKTQSAESCLPREYGQYTEIVYAERLNLRIYREMDRGTNPDLELLRCLHTKTNFRSIPRLVGTLELELDEGEPLTLGALREHIPNEGTAWDYSLDELGRYFERILAPGIDAEARPKAPEPLPLFERAKLPLPDWIYGLMGSSIEASQTLGEMTADMQLALGQVVDDPQFAPEEFTTFYQRGLYQSMRSALKQALRALGKGVSALPPERQAFSREFIRREAEILERYDAVRARRIHAMRIRCHGSFGLDKLLYTGRDFVVVDFRGDPRKPLGDRRIKRSPLRDFASLLRSMHLVACQAAAREREAIGEQPEAESLIDRWADFWYETTSGIVLRSYLDCFGDSPLIPREERDLQTLLIAYLIDEAVNEILDELDQPDGVPELAMKAILRILDLEPFV